MGWYFFCIYSIVCLAVASAAIFKNGVSFYYYGSVPIAFILFIVPIGGIRHHIKNKKIVSTLYIVVYILKEFFDNNGDVLVSIWCEKYKQHVKDLVGLFKKPEKHNCKRLCCKVCSCFCGFCPF